VNHAKNDVPLTAVRLLKLLATLLGHASQEPATRPEMSLDLFDLGTVKKREFLRAWG